MTPEPERIRTAEVVRLTSLSIATILDMARTGRIPGAAKLGGTWTFDPLQIRAWIRQQERKTACRTRVTSTKEATRTGAASALMAWNLDERFEQVTRKKPGAGSKDGSSRSSSPHSGARIVHS